MALTIIEAGLSTDANLTHYWSGDINFNDLKGSANGTDTNTPTYVAGKFSNAFTCVATSSQYTSVANDVFPWGTNTVWVHLWFKLSSINSTQSFTMTAETGQGLIIYYDGVNIVFSKPNVSDLSYAWTGEDTNWHMLDCYSDGSGMVIYLDNTNVASNINASNYVAPSTDLITWGGHRSGNVLQAGWYLDGQLDDIAIFTRIPTGAELTKLYSGIPSYLGFF